MRLQIYNNYITNKLSIDNLLLDCMYKPGSCRQMHHLSLLQAENICLLTYVPPGTAEGSTPVAAVSPTPAEASAPPAAVSPSPSENPAAGGTYTVMPGDTLWGIARKAYGDGAKWKVIVEANSDKVSAPQSLKVGTVLTIP